MLSSRLFNRQRSSGVLAMWLTLHLSLAHPSVAYEGREHADMSRFALLAALDANSKTLATETIENIKSTFLNCNSAPESQHCLDFGQLSRSPDYVSHPEYIFHDRHSCDNSSRRDQLTSKLRDRCARSIEVCPEWGSPSANPFDLMGYAENRLDSKARSMLGRLMAVHRNVDHFEACAAEAYNRFHRYAVEFAQKSNGDNWWVEPLVIEAVALHFLQDLTAPGHQLTPRAYASDFLARGLHNRLNKDGRTGKISASQVSHLLSALSQVQEELPESSVRIDLESLENAEGVMELTFLGDKSLRKQRNPDQVTQAAFLVLISTLSISEVLTARAAKDDSTIASFDFGEWRAGIDSSGVIDRDSYIRPHLHMLNGEGERLLSFSGSEPAAALDRYHLGLDVTTAFALSDGDTQYHLSLGLTGGFPGDRDVELVPDSESGVPGAGSDAQDDGAFLVTFAISYGDGRDLESRGLYLFGHKMRRFWKYHLSYYGGPQLGWERYLGDDVNSDRFIFGYRGGVGIGIFFFDAAILRDYRLVSPGKLENFTRVSVGLRMQMIR